MDENEASRAGRGRPQSRLLPFVPSISQLEVNAGLRNAMAELRPG